MAEPSVRPNSQVHACAIACCRSRLGAVNSRYVAATPVSCRNQAAGRANDRNCATSGRCFPAIILWNRIGHNDRDLYHRRYAMGLIDSMLSSFLFLTMKYYLRFPSC